MIRLTLALSLMGGLAVYACGSPTGPVVATIELPTSLSLWTSPAESAVSEHVYASPGGLQLSLTLYLPEYRDAFLFAIVRDEAGVSVSPTLTWTSSDASVVTVSSVREGSAGSEVSATGVGSATITASADGVTSNPVSVTVNEGTGSLPAIVYIHGGGWRGRGVNTFPPLAIDMAAEGFVGANIEYRRSGNSNLTFIFPAHVEDSKAAVRWLRANATTYRIDPEGIGVAGASAGGHLAAMVGTTSHIAEFEGDGGNPGFSSRVQAVAAFAGVFKLLGLPIHEPVESFLGATYAENPDLWALASPITHVSGGSPPFLLLHGTDDVASPYAQSVLMRNALEAVGVSAELFSAEGEGHDFQILLPWYQPTLEAMEEFFSRFLK